jgi:hypothetical protein
MNMAVQINDLPLPVSLMTALENGVWQTPKTPDAWRSLFPHEKARHAELYSLKMMQSENAPWPRESRPYYIGQADEHCPPGDIDPAKSLLIADLGPDKMIALDYRESSSRPPILHITIAPDGSSRWIRIAPDIETFIRALGLEAIESQTS